MTRTALAPLAPGCEELEAVTIIDVLRRGGMNVLAAGTHSGTIKASRGVQLVADILLQDAIKTDEYDLLVIPGGMEGTRTLLDNAPFMAFVQRLADKQRWIAAICAAPLILAKAGLLDGRRFTAYPGVVNASTYKNSTCTGAAIERDGHILTSRGPGTALDFALYLLETVVGAEQRTLVEKQLVRA